MHLLAVAPQGGRDYSIGAPNEQTNLKALHRTCGGLEAQGNVRERPPQDDPLCLENQEWMADVTSGAYRDWIALNYGAAQ